VFDIIVECPSVAELMKARFLVPTKVYAPSQPDLRGVRVEHGDYVESQLAQRVNTDLLVGDVVEHWLRLAERRPTVVFATGVGHSLHIRDEFRRASVMAEHIDGSTPIEERDRILAHLAAGQIEIVCNAMVLTEGWDQPSVSCLVLARPTKSLGLYRQMVGRVLRPAPGKDHALILDHSGATFMHGFAEDPIRWTLSEDSRAENKAHAARGTGEAPGALTNCPECSAVMLRGKPCGACGWRLQRRAEAVEVIDGELARLQRDRTIRLNTPTAADKDHFHRQLLWIAAERNYKPAWAGHKFRERFGHWPSSPPWSPPDPEPPSGEVRAWVRSRQIAFAKALQAQRGAA
jgi:superfamily II DNA or RNA helicase